MQGSLIIVPVPLQREQVFATEKNPCWNRTCPRPPHCVHVAGALPFALPGAAAVVARLLPADADLLLHAEDRLFKLQRQVVAQVAPALHPRSPPRAAHVEHLAEQIAEDVAQVALESAPPWNGLPAAPPPWNAAWP